MSALFILCCVAVVCLFILTIMIIMLYSNKAKEDKMYTEEPIKECASCGTLITNDLDICEKCINYAIKQEESE